MATTTKLLTVEEFFTLPSSRWCELIEGEVQLEVFPATGHQFESGPQTDRAVEVIKAFIVRQLSAP